MSSAKLIYDVSDKNPDLYYATRFAAPDSFIFLEHRGKKIIILSDLEFDRGKRQAQVDKVEPLSKYAALAKKKKANFTTSDIIIEVLKKRGVKKLFVPETMSVGLVDALRKKGCRVESLPVPFYPQRMSKTAQEKKYITKTQRVVFRAIDLARRILRESRIKGTRIFWRGTVLTSERMRRQINVFLAENECMGSDVIVACGHHSIDPHDIGSGPLMPHKSIIVDVFPRSLETFYFGDATRTFCKGEASNALRRLYDTVKKGQLLGLSKIRAGVNGRKVHEAIMKFFEGRGYKTGEIKGRRQGFFHSTGHGIGLEIHEEPARIGPKDFVLKKGYVMSVEPGLYYSDIGGVRIEDLVYITKNGCEVLAGYPKQLEVF